MFTAYLRAFGQVFDPRIVRILGVSVLLSVVVFALLWSGIAWLLTQSEVTSWWLLEKLLDVLGGVATIVTTFFVFPVVISATIGLFLDSVARAVEQRYYPDRKPKGLSVLAGIWASVRFLLKAVVINLVLLLVLFVPVLYPFAWLAANAYLLSREYFELVALRHLDARAARELRRSRSLPLFFAGLPAAGLFAIPVVNLIAPVLTTMAMVHVFERGRRAP